MKPLRYSGEKVGVEVHKFLCSQAPRGQHLWQPLLWFRMAISEGLLISTSWVRHPVCSEGRGASLCKRQLNRQMFDPAQNHFPNFLGVRAVPQCPQS